MTTKKAVTKKDAKPITTTTAPVDIPTVDEKALIATGVKLQAEVTAIKITSQEGFNAAALERTKIVQHKSYLESIFADVKKKANAVVTDLRNLEKKTVGPRIEFASGLLESLDKSMSNWTISERIRVAKEKREADEAEQKRIDTEKRKLEVKAEKLEDKGKDKQAEVVRAQADAVVFTPAPIKQAVSFAGTGASGRDDISVEITDMRLALKYIMDNDATVDMDSLFEEKYGAFKAYCKKHLPIASEESERKAPGITVSMKVTIAKKG